jgi:23S rRNA pseudouridine1911/1915/1917 synthase
MNELKLITISDDMYGKRIDQVLVDLFPDYSRSRLQLWLKAGDITIDNQIVKAKTKVMGGEIIQIQIHDEPEGVWEAENIPLDIHFEDEHILVINKPAGLVVHPAAGNRSGTLLNGLLYHHPDLINVPRAGIIHRLDKDTTGLLVVAKTLIAQTHLVNQLQQRSFEREYEALVVGELSGGGTIDTLYGRHPTQRTKMAVLRAPNNRGKQAITHYRILDRYAIHTRLKVNLETGRTHQIRVHMAYKQLPLVGDRVYGGRLKYPPNSSLELKNTLENFKRQALHARKLGLEHPQTHQWMCWEQPVPEDMQQLYDLLAENKNQ